MNHISSRTYDGQKDLQVMIDLITRVRPLKYLDDYPSKVDMEENFASIEIHTNTRLWFEYGQLIGWAFVMISGIYGGSWILNLRSCLTSKSLNGVWIAFEERSQTMKKPRWIQVAEKITRIDYPFYIGMALIRGKLRRFTWHVPCPNQFLRPNYPQDLSSVP